MTTNNKSQSPKLWHWYDLSKAGLFIAPEKVCGKSCLVLLDTSGFFTGENRELLSQNGFHPFVIENDLNISNHLYVSFTENLSINLFYTSLGVPIGTIKSVQQTLSNIQTELYQRALKITNYRVDLLLKTTSILGRNNKGEIVYNSHFGRFIIDTSSDIQTYLLENNYDERFLHATSPTGLISCVEGYVDYALKQKINLTIQDVIHFASIVFQKKDQKIDANSVKPSDLYNILEVFDFVYTKKIPYYSGENSVDFKNKKFFDLICELSENQPQKPNVTSDFLLNSLSTPSPLAFIAQKALVHGDDFEDKAFLNPMFGYGALTNFLSTHAVNISALEENPLKTDIISAENIPHTMVSLACAVSENLIEYNSMSLFDYVIANPAYETLEDQYRFDDGKLTPFISNQKDHVLVMKSLLSREDSGRSVYILRTVDLHDQEQLDENLNKLLQYISKRYKIEGLTRISGELYSKNNAYYHVALLVVGEKFDKLTYSQNTNFSAYLQSCLISDYQSLWDWCELICYTRSNEFTQNNEILDNIKNQANQHYIDQVNSQLLEIGNARAEYYESESFEQFDGTENHQTSNNEAQNAANQPSALAEMDANASSFQPNFENNDDLFDAQPAASENANSTGGEPMDEPNQASESNSTQSQESSTATPSTIVGGISLGGLDDDLETDADVSDRTQSAINLNQNTSTDNSESTQTTKTNTEATEEASQSESKDATSTTEGANDSVSLAKEETTNAAATTSTETSDSVSLAKEKSEDLVISKVAENKITKFDATLLSRVIRTHTISKTSESISNVSYRHFSSHLKSRSKLNDLIITAFNRLPTEKFKDKEFVTQWNSSADELQKYLSTHKCKPSIDAFVASKLKLGRPQNLKNFYLAEHVDAIASSIIRIMKNESIFLLDSAGLHPELVMASMLRYAVLSNRLGVYVSRSLESFGKLHDAWVLLEESFAVKTHAPINVFNFNDDNAKQLSKLKNNEILVINQDAESLGEVDRNKSSFNDLLKTQQLYCVLDVVDNLTLPTSIRKLIDDSPTLFNSHEFINQNSDFKLYRTLFPADTYQRYFQNPISELDDIGFELLKSTLIEDGILFERFEDLSNLDVSSIKNDITKQAIYEKISSIITVILNNIVLLSDKVRKINASKKLGVENFVDLDFRGISLEIQKYTNFCLKSETLTQSIVNQIKSHTKPIVVVPNIVEKLLYTLLQYEIQIDSSTNLSLLNEQIEAKTNLVEKQALIFELTGDSTGYYQLSGEIENLVQIRSKAVSSYLLNTISGTEKKVQPQLSDLIELFFIQATLVEDSVDLWSKKYRTVVENDVRDFYNEIKDQINKLPNIPLMMLDNIKFDLSKFNINVAEISTRTLALEKSDAPDLNANKIWNLASKQPYQDSLMNDEEMNVAHSFNSGYVDVLFVESSQIKNHSLAAINYTQYGVPSDHYRQRVLMFTYFEIDIESILQLINSVNKQNQWLQPSVRFMVGESLAEHLRYELMVQQLDRFSIRNNFSDAKSYSELAFYLTSTGRHALNNYLNYNVDILNLIPSKPAKEWTIFDVLTVCSISTNNVQQALYNDLIQYHQSYLNYLKNINAHPFELYYVKPQARVTGFFEVPAPLRMISPITHKSSLAQSIKSIRLEYLKDKSKNLSIADLKAHQEICFSQLKDDLKNFLPTDSHKGDLITDLSTYVQMYENLIVSTFGKLVKDILLDKNLIWKYKGPNFDKTKTAKIYYGAKHKKTSKEDVVKHIEKLNQNIATLFVGVEIIGDSSIKRNLLNAVQTLTFLKCFLLSVAEMMNKNEITPIILPVPSPFRENTTKQAEGLMIGIKLSRLNYMALSSYSHTVITAYPQKSKPQNLSLAYVLSHYDVLQGQSVIAEIPENLQEFVSRSAVNAIDQAHTRLKLSQFNNNPIRKFAMVSDYADNTAPVMQVFTQKTPPVIDRSMDILFGNVFEAYYTLKDTIPLTRASFIDANGNAQIGFIIPSEIDIKSVTLCLEESTNLVVMRKTIERLIAKEPWFNIPKIQFVNSTTSITVSQLDAENLNVILKGYEYELREILMDEKIFAGGKNAGLGLVINHENTTYSGNKTVLNTTLPISKYPNFIKILYEQGYYQLALLRSCSAEVKNRYFPSQTRN